MSKCFTVMALAASVSRPCTAISILQEASETVHNASATNGCVHGPSSFDYEIATDCAGGQNGNPFTSHYKDQYVTRIDFYYVEHCEIGRICLGFGDSQDLCVGSQDFGAGTKTSLGFGEGDTFSGDVDIYHSSESRHSQTHDMVSGMKGRIHRKSAGVTDDFAIGGCLKGNHETIKGTDGKVLTGMFGGAGSAIDNLGLLLRDPLACLVEPGQVTGEWSPLHVLDASGTKLTLGWGVSYTHSESKTESWKSSVAHSIDTKFGFLEEGETITISGEKAHQLATSDASALTTDYSVSWDQTYDSSYIGKLMWQWRFTAGDTCSHTEIGLAQESAFTDGAWWEPCCLPGWHMDVIGATTCKTADSMAPGGLARGCKVDSASPQSFTNTSTLLV